MKKLYIIAALMIMSLAALAQDVLTVKTGDAKAEIPLEDSPVLNLEDKVAITSNSFVINLKGDQPVTLIVRDKSEEQTSGSTLRGDVNEDGSVTMTDANMIVNIFVNQ